MENQGEMLIPISKREKKKKKKKAKKGKSYEQNNLSPEQSCAIVIVSVDSSNASYCKLKQKMVADMTVEPNLAEKKTEILLENLQQKKKRQKKQKKKDEGRWDALSGETNVDKTLKSDDDDFVNINCNVESSSTSKKKRKLEKEKGMEVLANAKSVSLFHNDEIKIEENCKDVEVIDVIDSPNKSLVMLDQKSVAVNSDTVKSRKKVQVQPDWFSPLHDVTGGGYKKTLEMLKRKGIVANKGKWKADEVQKLHDNMMEFLSSREVKDFRTLVVPRTEEDLLFRKNTDFVLKMCRGIQRTRRDIDLKIVQQYSNFLKKGAWSDEEKAKLVELQKVHGNKWKEIGFVMNRYHSALHITHNQVSRQWNKGSWSNEEDNLLITSVNPYLERKEQISWVNVSKLVGTRTLASCHARWYGHLSKHINERKEEITFSDEDAYKLVTYINDSNIDDDYFIDWSDVASHFDNKYKPGWLKWKFGVISKEVRYSHLLEFVDLIEQLYDIYEKKNNV